MKKGAFYNYIIKPMFYTNFKMTHDFIFAIVTNQVFAFESYFSLGNVATQNRN